MTGRKTSTDLSKCPPSLRALIEREGNVKSAAQKLSVSVFMLRDVVSGKREMPGYLDTAITKALGADAPPAPAAPKTYADWDGKRVDAKVRVPGGKFKTIKKVPAPFAKLLDQLDNKKNTAARAAGYSGWGEGFENILKHDDKYRAKLHNAVMAILAGDPLPPRNGNGHDHANEPDTYKLGLAIVTTTLTNYDRVEEICSVLNGQRVFRKNTKAGLLVIYKFLQREKTETFKRLAKRDASDIVCP
jgi:hypothetical protein